MFEDAASFTVTLQVYAYGLFVAAGTAVTALVFFLLCRKAKLPYGITQFWGITALVAGLILSRAFYCLGDTGFASVASLKAVFLLSGGGYSMMGALTGACLATVLTAFIFKIKNARLLDIALLALMAFVAIARLGEGYTFLGVSRPLVDSAFRDTFLVKYDIDYYLRTYLMESAIALVLLVVLLRGNSKPHRDGDTMLKGVLYFGASQTLMESLRYDGHMRFEFIGVQQVFCVLLFASVTVIAGLRLLGQGGKKTLPWAAISALPLIAVALIGLEFLIDRSGISRYILYTGYALILLCQGLAATIMINRSYYLWKKKK